MVFLEKEGVMVKETLSELFPGWRNKSLDSKEDTLRVVVTDVDIKFWTLVNLMMKFFFASIPAAIGIYFLVSVGLIFFKEFL